jgi:hypothetical protein
MITVTASATPTKSQLVTRQLVRDGQPRQWVGEKLTIGHHRVVLDGTPILAVVEHGELFLPLGPTNAEGRLPLGDFGWSELVVS